MRIPFQEFWYIIRKAALTGFIPTTEVIKPKNTHPSPKGTSLPFWGTPCSADAALPGGPHLASCCSNEHLCTIIIMKDRGTARKKSRQGTGQVWVGGKGKICKLLPSFFRWWLVWKRLWWIISCHISLLGVTRRLLFSLKKKKQGKIHLLNLWLLPQNQVSNFRKVIHYF